MLCLAGARDNVAVGDAAWLVSRTLHLRQTTIEYRQTSERAPSLGWLLSVLHRAAPTCRGQWEMGEYTFYAVYTQSRGLTFSSLTDKCNGMLAVWGIFLVQIPLFMLLGWYLEQVIGHGTGVRRHWLFFLERWIGKVGGTWLLGSREKGSRGADTARAGGQTVVWSLCRAAHPSVYVVEVPPAGG